MGKSEEFRVSVWEEPIHPMDPGSLHFKAEVWWLNPGNVHTVSFRPVWFGCGETGFDISCSCGFHTEERMGYGCWQDGHNVRQSPKLDVFHARAWLEVLEQIRATEFGYPALLDYLEDIAFKTLFEVSGSDGVSFASRNLAHGMPAICDGLLASDRKDWWGRAYLVALAFVSEDQKDVESGLSLYFALLETFTGLSPREVKRMIFLGGWPDFDFSKEVTSEIWDQEKAKCGELFPAPDEK